MCDELTIMVAVEEPFNFAVGIAKEVEESIMDCASRSRPPFWPVSPMSPLSSISGTFNNLRQYYEEKLAGLQEENCVLRCSLQTLADENASLKEEQKAGASKLDQALKELVQAQHDIAMKCRERSNAREKSRILREQLRSAVEDVENVKKFHDTYKQLFEVRVAERQKNLMEEYQSWKRQAYLDVKAKLYCAANQSGEKEAWQRLFKDLDSVFADPLYIPAAISESKEKLHQLKMKQKEDASLLKEELIRRLEVDCQHYQVLLNTKEAETKSLELDLKKLHSRLRKSQTKIQELQEALNASRVPTTPQTGTAGLSLLTPQVPLSAPNVFLSQPISSYPAARQRCDEVQPAGRHCYHGSAVDRMESLPAVVTPSSGDQNGLEPAAKRLKVEKASHNCILL